MTTIDTIAADTTETVAPVTVAIDDGPLTPDHDGRSRGWDASLHLDPEDRTVTVHAGIGNGTTFAVWHGRALSLAVDKAASGEHLRAVLESEEAQTILDEICGCYEGERWDGNNNIGQWSKDEDGEEPHRALVDQLEAMIAEVPCYSSAADWIGCAWGECRSEVEAAILGAASDGAEEAALDALAVAWIDNAEETILDRGDVRDQIDAMAEQLVEDGAERDVYLAEVTGGGAPECAPLDTMDLDKTLADIANIGETWCIVEASTPVDAWRKARALRSQGGAVVVAEARRLAGEWNYPEDALDRIVAALPA